MPISSVNESSLDKNYASETEGTEVKLNRKERRRQQFSSKERFGERRGGGKKGFRDERDERRTRRDNERGFKKGDKGSAKGAKKVTHGNFDKFKKKKGERS